MYQLDTDSIFKTFKRLNTKKYEGSDIGLAICKKIIDLYKCKMTFTNKLDEGTTFYIELPVSEWQQKHMGLMNLFDAKNL